MSERKRIGRNMGRIELLAVRDTVSALLEAGYDRKKIHSRLVEEGSVTMSYPTFCYQFKQQFRSSNTPAAAPSPARRAGSSGLTKADKSETFSIPRKPKLEDFQ
jgi:hypothetical protein